MSRLERSSQRLGKARALLSDLEDIGDGIASNLADNRQKIESAHGKVRHHDGQVAEADLTTRRMLRRNW